jgi:NTE family protein
VFRRFRHFEQDQSRSHSSRPRAALIYGHSLGGNKGARNALEGFWCRVSEVGRFSPIRRGPLDVLLGRWSLDYSPTYIAMDTNVAFVLTLRPQYGRVESAARHPHRRSHFERVAQSPIKRFLAGRTYL